MGWSLPFTARPSRVSHRFVEVQRRALLPNIGERFNAERVPERIDPPNVHPLTGTTRTFAFQDTEGRDVLNGHLNEPDMVISSALAPHRLGEALDLRTPVFLPSLTPEAVVGRVSPDVMEGGRTLKYHAAPVRLGGVVTEFDGELQISPDSPMGRELIELGFEPTVVYRDPNVMFVIDLAPDGTPLIP